MYVRVIYFSSRKLTLNDVTSVGNFVIDGNRRKQRDKTRPYTSRALTILWATRANTFYLIYSPQVLLGQLYYLTQPNLSVKRTEH